MKHKIKQTKILILFGLLILPLLTQAKSLPLVVHVTDQSGQPLLGATVLIEAEGELIAGAATDSGGEFQERLTLPINWPLSIKASSVGYTPTTIIISEPVNQPLIIKLSQQDHKLESVKIRPEQKLSGSSEDLSSRQISDQARTSLVSTNVAAAIRVPQVTRAGSAHSSQLRVYGTSPMYYYNGIPIGYDPNHYGMFTILPSPAVTKTKTTTLGTDASYGLPSIVSLEGHRKFNKYSIGQLQLSTLDATASYSVGFGSGFLSSTVRKSVLDKLVDKLSISSNKKTLPPTNFQDVIVAGGLRLSQRVWLKLDGYHTRDFLAYNIDPGGDVSSISTRQNSQQRHLALHLDYIFRQGVLNISLAARDQHSEYLASPDGTRDMFVDLTEDSRTGYGRVNLTLPKNDWKITLGAEGEYTPKRTVSLNQNNWNFLSPFANSDNPYIYQEALNQEYATYEHVGKRTQAAGYFSLEKQLGSFSIEAGPRVEYFSSLSERKVVSLRFRATLESNEDSKSELFLGSFNENPINNILEPYQIQILANLGQLKPIRKKLLALSHAKPWLKTTLFIKRIENLPLLTPDFDNGIGKDGQTQSGFIRAESRGALDFYGGTLALMKEDFPLPKMSLNTAYAYTQASRQESSLTIPYELEAPHQLHIDLTGQVSKRWKLGVRYQIRSGNPYTPSAGSTTMTDNRYSQEYYLESLKLTNSARFSSHASLDFYGSYSAESFKFFFAVSNLTSHANPIISSRSGLVYDAGILPMLGINYAL